MNSRARWTWLLITACLLTTGVTQWSGPASASGKRSLRARHETLSRRIENQREQLRNLKAQQRTQRNQLVQAQVELDQAEDDLAHATATLNHTRSVLADVKQDHKVATVRHLVQKKRMESRIRAQFEAGNPSYVEVVLDATSFAEFNERAEVTAVIAEHDQSLVSELLATRQSLARQEALVKQKEQEEAAARADVARQKKSVAVKTEVAEVRLKATNADRAEAEKQLAEMEQASREIESMLSRVQHGGVSCGAYSGSWGGSFQRPVPGYVSSSFGWRIHPITHTRRFHDGVDLACSGGTPIHAAAKGRVIHAGWWGAYGIAVIIDHGSGMSTLYGHCERGSLRVSAGDVVSRGQVVASVDSTGFSTGDHCHFSVRRYGTPVSPY
jgi:murein DD-endopeptidase MepM/ murein hydrolase activator NlpD